MLTADCYCERRSGVERRIFSYSWCIPERRSGLEQRDRCSERSRTTTNGGIGYHQLIGSEKFTSSETSLRIE